jgi:hypothetical protein
MESSTLSDAAKLLLLSALLSQDRVIPNNSKAFLKGTALVVERRGVACIVVSSS